MKTVLMFVVAAFAMICMSASSALATDAKVVSGVVRSVDAEAGSFVVASKGDKLTTLHIGVNAGDVETGVTLNGKKSSFAVAVQAKRKVTVTCSVAGEANMATTIAVTTSEDKAKGAEKIADR